MKENNKNYPIIKFNKTETVEGEINLTSALFFVLRSHSHFSKACYV